MHEPSPDQSSRLAAREAGLRYATDEVPGFSRRRRGKGFSYLDRDGNVIRDAEVVSRIRSIVIPPAWTDVWICPWPNGHMQATGRDARGRKQHRYHAEYRAARDEAKFGRLVEFAAALPRIRKRVDRDLGRPGVPREKVLAAVVRLLELTPDPRRQRRVFAAEPLVRPDDAPRPARQGRRHADPVPLPGQGRHAPRGRPARSTSRGAGPAVPGSARPGPVPVRRERDGPQRDERRRQRVPARGLRWRFHGQGLPHLGRDGARLPRAVRDARGRRRADRKAERGRGGQASRPGPCATPRPSRARPTSTRKCSRRTSTAGSKPWTSTICRRRRSAVLGLLRERLDMDAGRGRARSQGRR